MIDENEMVGLNALSDNTKHISELVAYVLDMTDLNTCDECGVVQYSDDLNWWQYMSGKDQVYWSQHKNGDALCNDCWRD
jgi:hypothetical protein|tara:strand:+ start:489 stop:725 length:237 start_codon:yes stop_codon:yes gene_type:complete